MMGVDGQEAMRRFDFLQQAAVLKALSPNKYSTGRKERAELTGGFQSSQKEGEMPLTVFQPWRNRFDLGQCIVMLLLSLLAWIVISQGALLAADDEQVRAPEFPEGLAWLNTDKPLRMADLRGKVVLLDFWTYCCINCMHVIPELAYLEQKYRNELVVIGVHSAKFTNEEETDNIRQAILRYDVEHPVVNDHKLQIMREYGVQAWPTIMVVKPNGDIRGYVSGENNQEVLEQVIDQLIAEAREQGILNTTPMTFALEKETHTGGALSFPGKVYAHAHSNRLFIADSHHNRIVIADLKGNVLAVAGSGAVGQADGDFATASFHHPQGMALHGQALYVADTKNHLLRRLDLETRQVTTIAGTGEKAQRRNVSGRGTHAALNSPWDLERLDSRLFIAMAGWHQIWAMDLETHDLAPYAGTGREVLRDGPRLQSGMAQPSGITSDGAYLFVADSEASAIRAISRGRHGGIWTILGQGLFKFGDRDGAGAEDVRLQHPLGIDYDDGVLYLADTYNHKIKKIDPATAAATTYLGSGKAGHQDGKAATFYEPGGLSVAAGKLYIADTNNHAIRVADLQTNEVTTLRLRGLSTPTAIAGFSGASFGVDEIVRLSPQPVKAGQRHHLTLQLDLPAGYHLNPRAPLSYRVEIRGEGITMDEADQRFHGFASNLPLTIPFQAAASQRQAELTVDLTFYYCREDNTGVCAIQSVRWEAPFHTVDDQTAVDPILSYKAALPSVKQKKL